MEPSSPDVKRPWRNLISTPGPNSIQLQSLYMTKDSACPLSSLMACTRSTGQQAGKINGYKTKRSITERGRERERQMKSMKATTYIKISKEEEESLLQSTGHQCTHRLNPVMIYMILPHKWINKSIYLSISICPHTKGKSGFAFSSMKYFGASQEKSCLFF